MMESKLYPGSFQLEPMKYCSKASEEQARAAWESGDWISEEKKDGALYQLEKTDEGRLYLFSRTKSKKTGELAEKLDNFPQIQAFGKHLPNGTILVGEVYVPGGKSNDTTRLTGCLPAKALLRQFNEGKADVFLGPARYYIFDVIRYSGELLVDRSTLERIDYFKDIQNILDNIEEPCYVEVAEVYYDNFEEHLQNIFAAGGEGMVFKHKDCPYRVGKRSTVKQMFKWKQSLDSIDLVCMELLDPVYIYTGKELKTWPYWAQQYETENGSFSYVLEQNNLYEEYLKDSKKYVPVTKPAYHGWKNAMRLGAYKDGKLVEVSRVASGLTDELREDMASNPDNYLDKVIEVKCMSVSQDGTLRHPVFVRVRDDKTPQDCKWEEIFN